MGRTLRVREKCAGRERFFLPGFFAPIAQQFRRACEPSAQAYLNCYEIATLIASKRAKDLDKIQRNVYKCKVRLRACRQDERFR